MVFKTWSEAVKDKSGMYQCHEGDHLILVAVDVSGAEPIEVARRVVSKAICANPLLVLPKAAGLVKMIYHKNVTRTHECMTHEGIKDVYLRRSFHITIASFRKVDVNPTKHQTSSKVTIANEDIAYP